MDIFFNTRRLYSTPTGINGTSFIVSDECSYSNVTDYTLQIEGANKSIEFEFDGLLATNASIKMSESDRKAFLNSEIWRTPGDVTVGYMGDIESISRLHRFISSILNRNSALVTPWLVLIDVPAKYFSMLRSGLLTMNKAGLHGLIIETEGHRSRLCRGVLEDPFCIQLKAELNS